MMEFPIFSLAALLLISCKISFGCPKSGAIRLKEVTTGLKSTSIGTATSRALLATAEAVAGNAVPVCLALGTSLSAIARFWGAIFLGNSILDRKSVVEGKSAE